MNWTSQYSYRLLKADRMKANGFGLVGVCARRYWCAVVPFRQTSSDIHHAVGKFARMALLIGPLLMEEGRLQPPSAASESLPSGESQCRPAKLIF
jgi:hypothetical protein